MLLIYTACLMPDYMTLSCHVLNDTVRTLIALSASTAVTDPSTRTRTCMLSSIRRGLNVAETSVSTD